METSPFVNKGVLKKFSPALPALDDFRNKKQISSFGRYIFRKFQIERGAPPNDAVRELLLRPTAPSCHARSDNSKAAVVTTGSRCGVENPQNDNIELTSSTTPLDERFEAQLKDHLSNFKTQQRNGEKVDSRDHTTPDNAMQFDSIKVDTIPEDVIQDNVMHIDTFRPSHLGDEAMSDEHLYGHEAEGQAAKNEVSNSSAIEGSWTCEERFAFLKEWEKNGLSNWERMTEAIFTR